MIYGVVIALLPGWSKQALPEGVFRGQKKMRKTVVAAALVMSAALVSGWAGTARAVDVAELKQMLAERISARDRDPAAWAALLRRGQEQASFCSYCHGKDGISVKPLVPNLAGQNPNYLLDQIDRFATGKRQDFIMTPLARQYGPEDRIAVAVYYSSMTPIVHAADPDLIARGQARFRQRCVGCHGMDAHGGENYARLAGQNEQYIKHRLFYYQQPQSLTKVAPTIMNSVAKDLSDEDVDAVAAFLSNHP
jgi:cytochrome c553